MYLLRCFTVVTLKVADKSGIEVGHERDSNKSLKRAVLDQFFYWLLTLRPHRRAVSFLWTRCPSSSALITPWRGSGPVTKKGIPTAATYVFVNMLRKLRADFNPEYLAAVFDVAGPTFRDEQAKTVTSVRKFDIKTQTFKDVEYLGYKAQRKEMPHDLAQQVPYIRRALEAYRIPILESQGFEADDVIGTLGQSRRRGYQVFVVSSDKDMLQLVNDKVCVLNPPKDNLICDSAKVEEILGVRPEQVIDVMALRGDSIDNIPGAPGIGDKGSVEIIKRFGTLENALEQAGKLNARPIANRCSIIKTPSFGVSSSSPLTRTWILLWILTR